jgi:hypothetical protein
VLEKAEVATLGDNRKVYTKLKQDHALAVGKAFAAVLNCLTPQGKEAVRSHKAFAEARSTDDLVKLRKIVDETQGTTYGMSNTETAQQLRRCYYALRQKTEQGIFSFRAELDQLEHSLQVVRDNRLTEEKSPGTHRVARPKKVW